MAIDVDQHEENYYIKNYFIFTEIQSTYFYRSEPDPFFIDKKIKSM